MAHGLADPPHHLDVAVRIDADLDLDGADAFLRDLRDLALGLREIHQPDRMGDRNAPAAGAAEQAMHGKAALPAGEIIGREFDGGLGVGIALDGAIHPRMQFGDLARHATRDRRRQISRHDLDRRSRALAEIAAELAAPILECGRLAPAGDAGVVAHLDEDVAADGLGEAGPFVLAPGRQRDVNELDGSDGSSGHAPSSHAPAL